MPGASNTSTPYSRTSLPRIAVVRSTRSMSQELARSVPTGNPVATVWAGSLNGSIRTPAGPSEKTVCGIPRRGMARVPPARPGTRLSELVPTRRDAFSSRVMACKTSSMLSSRNCGCARAAAMDTNKPIVKQNFLIYNNLSESLSVKTRKATFVNLYQSSTCQKRLLVVEPGCWYR